MPRKPSRPVGEAVTKVGRRTGAAPRGGERLSGPIKATSRAKGRLTADLIQGPAPGRRTVSDKVLREAVRAAIRGRAALVDA